MKSVCSVLCVVLLTFVMSGCNGIQVVDNVYGPMGGQNVTVEEGFTYLGSPNVYVKSNCVSECPTVAMPNTKIRSDVFAKEQDGKLAEVCVFERRMLSGNFYWMPVKGAKVTYGGKEYSEYYVEIVGKTDGDYINFYVNHLGNQGYDMNIEGVAVRTLVRNINNTNQIIMIYACNLGLIPESIRKDKEKKEEYLREMFDKRFVVADS